MSKEMKIQELKRRASEIGEVRSQCDELRVRLRGLEAEYAALARQVASDDEDVVSVSERVARFVESQDGPVGAKDVARHLRAEDVVFKEESLSTQLLRHVNDGRLWKAGRGKYCAAGVEPSGV